MISHIKFFVYLAFMVAMIFGAVYIQELRTNLIIAEEEYKVVRETLELKSIMLHRTEVALKNTEKISMEREQRLEELSGRLREANILLEGYVDETTLPIGAISILRSLGIVREDGDANKDRVCDSVQSDASSGTVDAEKGSSDDAGKDL